MRSTPDQASASAASLNMYVLEINDWEIRLLKNDDELILSEPAVGLYLDNKLIFGHQALQASRLHPQSFANQYISRLSSEPLNKPLGESKNQADLLYRHLKALNIKEELVVLIPSNFTNEKLGIFLGIAKQAGISIKGFVDAPLAYTLEVPSSEDLHVLDLDLHQTSITQIHIEGNKRSVVDNRSIESMGFTSIIDGWLNVIADEFIQKTRFDPFHFAQTEQQLFDCVIQHLQNHAADELKVEITHNQQDRLVSLSTKMLTDKLESKVNNLELDTVQSLVITHRVLQIPGLYQILESTVPVITKIQKGQLYKNIAQLTSGMNNESVSRITSGISAAEIVTQDKRDDGAKLAHRTPATHLLHDNHACRLDDPAVSSHTSSLAKTLLVGEQVQIDSKTYIAISVE